MLPPLARTATRQRARMQQRRRVELSLFELVVLHDALGLALFPEDHDRLGIAGEQLEIIQRKLAGLLALDGIHAEVTNGGGG